MITVAPVIADVDRLTDCDARIRSLRLAEAQIERDLRAIDALYLRATTMHDRLKARLLRKQVEAAGAAVLRELAALGVV